MSDDATAQPSEPRGIILGLASIAGVALVSFWLGGYFPQFGAAIIAMVIGLLLRNVFSLGEQFPTLTDLFARHVLKFAIVLLGATFTLGQALTVGAQYFPVVLLTIGVAIVAALFAGLVLRVPRKLSTLIGAGTAICGATAILAISPLLRSRREETAYAVATIFLFNTVAMLTFPLVGGWLGLDQTTFGAWAGAAIHDTSSVLAAGFAFGDVAGETSVVVKLGRTLMLVPLVLGLSLVVAGNDRAKRKGGPGRARAIVRAVPWFIVAFLAMTALATAGIIGQETAGQMGSLAKALIVTVLAAVGLGTELGQLRRLGPQAMAVACGASVLAAVISLLVLLQIR